MDIQPEKTCCFTGHRPQFFPWGSNTGDPAAAKMLRALESEILQAIADSYTTFLYGGALGVDAWAAEIVLRLRKNLPLTLMAILPFPGYNADVTENSYRQTIAASDRILCVEPVRRMAALAARDRYMKGYLSIPKAPNMAGRIPSRNDGTATSSLSSGVRHGRM